MSSRQNFRNVHHLSRCCVKKFTFQDIICGTFVFLKSLQRKWGTFFFSEWLKSLQGKPRNVPLSRMAEIFVKKTSNVPLSRMAKIFKQKTKKVHLSKDWNLHQESYKRKIYQIQFGKKECVGSVIPLHSPQYSNFFELYIYAGV